MAVTVKWLHQTAQEALQEACASPENWTALLAAVLFAAPLAPRLRDWTARRDFPLLDILYAAGAGLVFLVSAAFISKGTYNPFIYFNF